MGQIGIRGVEIHIEGSPPYLLPENMNKEFIDALLAAEPGDEAFIGEVAKHLSAQDKLLLKSRAKNCGDDTWKSFCIAASKWAAILNQDNRWHLEDFEPVYEAEINSSWAHNVILTTTNIRFVRTARGIFTFPEFLHVYGMNIVEHISQWQERTHESLEEVKKHITSEMERRQLSVVDAQGNIVRKEFVGLVSMPPERWRLPDGYTFLSIEE